MIGKTILTVIIWAVVYRVYGNKEVLFRLATSMDGYNILLR